MIYGSLPGSVPLGGFFSQTTLTAQSMTLIPAATPCYDPCTIFITVTWINNTSGPLPANQSIGITIDGITPPDGTTTTSDPIPVGGTVSHTFTVASLVHTNINSVCPVPN